MHRRLDGQPEAPARGVIDWHEKAAARANAQWDSRDHGREGDNVGGHADVGVALRRRAQAGVAIAIPLVADLDGWGAVVLPDADRHRVGRYAGRVGAVVWDVRRGQELVQPGNVAGVQV